MNSEAIHESEQVAWEHLPGEDSEEPRHVGLGVRWFTSHGMGGALSRKLRRGGSAESGCHWIIWRYFIYSVLVGRCSRSLNSPPLLMIQGLFKSIFTIVLFKGPKETRDVSTFLTFQIWIFLCRFPHSLQT